MLDVLERALTSLEGKEPDEVPVVLLVYGLVLKSIAGVSEYEYYQDLDLQLKAKLEFQRMFPDVWNVTMGTYPEYAEFVGPMPTAFGGEIEWLEDAPPYVSEYPIKEPEDVDRLVEAGIPDPRTDGIAPEFLKRLQYFLDNFPKDIREKYNYLDGNIYPGLGPSEGASLCMGYDTFLVWMRLHPDVLHKWLDLTTTWLIKYCEAIEELVGKCKILFLPDHSASMVGDKFFNEFILPRLNRIFKHYKGALRIWHNEGSVGHMLSAVDKIDAEVWHFGPFDDSIECKKKTHFCLMGNIHPPWLAKATPAEVEEACKELILNTASGGKFWLSTGGGMAPGTPFDNIRAMFKAVEKYGKYPIKR